MTPTDKNAIITNDISTEHRERVRMNKLSKFLWGILSFGISAIYRVDTNAAHYTNIADVSDPVVGDTIDVDCYYGKLKLRIVYAYNHASDGQGNNNDIPTDENCTTIDDYLCLTTTSYTNKCGANQTASPKHTSAVDPADFSCKTLTCPDGGTLGKYAQIEQEKLDLTKNNTCRRYYTGGTGHRFIGFSFIISGITASSGWYGSFITSNSDNWANQTYNIYWEQVNNNSINDCYIAPGTYTDSNGNTYQQVDTDNKCYYKG